MMLGAFGWERVEVWVGGGGVEWRVAYQLTVFLQLPHTEESGSTFNSTKSEISSSYLELLEESWCFSAGPGDASP